MGGGWRHHHHHHHQQQELHENSSPTANHQNGPGRALRNRRYRRILEESQQTKRLFTPEIKRFLKGWLVRRRKNPYPNRTEKKELAFKTGLTYIQICNWFANWRRKLKNSSRNTEESWGHLIKDYNNKAKGNVEQFSISSDDSIWDETAFHIDSDRGSTRGGDECRLTETDHCYYSSSSNNNNNNEDDDDEDEDEPEEELIGERERRHSMKDCSSTCSSPCHHNHRRGSEGGDGGRPEVEEETVPLLSKWMESAARYRASASYVPWAAYNVTWSSPRPEQQSNNWRAPRAARAPTRHREELDAAEALAFLSASTS